MADISAPALLLKCCEKYFLNVFLNNNSVFTSQDAKRCFRP